MADLYTLKPGDKLLCPIHSNGIVLRQCTVLWIHPEKRFYLVECETPGGKLRECYSFFGLID